MDTKIAMKAYCVYPGETSFDEGCVLVFAENRNKAKSIALHSGPWIGLWYLDFNAKRAPNFDKHYNGRIIHDTNETLPEPFFIEDGE